MEEKWGLSKGNGSRQCLKFSDPSLAMVTRTVFGCV